MPVPRSGESRSSIYPHRLFETVLKTDGCAVIQRNRIHICVIRRQLGGADVEYPLLVGSILMENGVTARRRDTVSSTLITVPEMIFVKKKLLTTSAVPTESPFASHTRN
jgi:hypothetical protein